MGIMGEESTRDPYDGVSIEPVTEYLVKYKEAFSMQYLYYFMHEWLVIKGYADKDQDFGETFFLIRETPPTKEIQIRWRLNRYPDKGNKFWRYDLRVDFLILAMKDKEIAVQGKKKTVDSGEIEIKIKAVLVYDSEGKWNKGFWKWVLEKYVKRISIEQFNIRADALLKEAYEFQEAIKTYFKMGVYTEEPPTGGLFDTVRFESG